MEASVRIFSFSGLNRLLLRARPLKRSCRVPIPYSPVLSIASNPYCSTRFHSPQNSSPLGFILSLSALHKSESSLSGNNFDPFVSDSNDKSFKWSFASDGVIGGDVGISRDKGPMVTAVLLGWLGAKPKHLKRYVELYNSRGIHAVTFLASVTDVLSFDLGRKLQERTSELFRELVSWLGESEKDGRERLLIFHTFSNTGWLAYGTILQNLQGRQDLLAKIKGIVVDSGGDPEIDPKVWAAGFAAALLKKHSSSASPSTLSGEGNEWKEPSLIETMLLAAFDNLFSFLLNLPDIKERLSKVISTLLKNQPPCPQLYLYSTADKVIPWDSVELFIEEQRRMGRKVWSFNFGSSPHVDHYRSFPDIYSSQLHNFLKECLLMNKSLKNLEVTSRFS